MAGRASEQGYFADHHRPTTLREAISGLVPVLTRLLADNGRWVMVLSVPGAGRYVQVLVYEDGSSWAECVSNTYLTGTDRLTEADEDLLRHMGWQPPEPGQPNWHIVRLQPEPQTVADLLTGTLREVFGLGVGDTLAVKLFRSRLEGGDTPASESSAADRAG